MSLSNVRLNSIGEAAVKKLPDGRKQIVRRWEVISDLYQPSVIEAQCFQLPGTPDGQFEDSFANCIIGGRPDIHYPELRLIDQEISQPRERQSKAILTKVYEEIPESAEIQVGKDAMSRDANGRDVLTRTTLQFSSAPYVAGEPGTVLAVDGINYALNTSEKADNGTLRTITRQYLEATDTFVNVGPDLTDFEISGLRRLTQTIIARAGTDFPVDLLVGTAVYDGCYLATVSDTGSTHAVTRYTLQWIAPGIIDADKQFDADAGLLYVTFQSIGEKVVPTCLKAGSALNDDPTVAFQGGTAASIFRDRIRNVKGLPTFVVTVMMKIDGTPLVTDGTENTVNSYQVYLQYGKPGEVSVGSGGIEATPGNTRYLLAQVNEVLTTDSTLPAGYKPFSVKSWAHVNASYIPLGETTPILVSKGAQGYLASSSYAGNVWGGEDVESASAVAGSNPTPTAFYALTNQVISSDNGPSFITDTGQRWYRRRKITSVGSFAQLND